MRNELSTEDLAAEVDQLKQHLDEVRRGVAFRDQVAEWGMTQPAEPVYQDTPADQFVAEQPRARPPLPAVTTQTTQVLTRQALADVSQQIPDWNRYSERVMRRVREQPEHLAAAVQSGDPGRIATHLASVYSTTKSSEQTRLMRMAAQTAVGASGRTPAPGGDADEWAAVVAARPRNYWESARSWADVPPRCSAPIA